jgi:hypothetical protein
LPTEENTKKALQIDPEFRSLLPILTAQERVALEQSIEREGCRDALIVWGDTLVDGHNRHEICTRRGFPFEVRQMVFDSREDVLIWICANQNARRNITPEQKAYLQGRMYKAEKKKAGARTDLASPQNGERLTTAERIAAELGVSKNTIERAWQYARAVDTLAEASPTIKRKILSGEIKLPRAAIVAIASKSEAERKAAVDRMERGDPPITNTVDVLNSGDSVPEYTIEEVLDEFRLSAERFMSLVRNTYEQQSALMGDAKNTGSINAFLKNIADKICNLRKD